MLRAKRVCTILCTIYNLSACISTWSCMHSFWLVLAMIYEALIVLHRSLWSFYPSFCSSFFSLFSVHVLVPGLVHYILIITLVLIVLFSQIIPCRVRRNFLEHVGALIGDHRLFMVTMTQMTVPTRSFRVQCTNEAGRTYISGASWTHIVGRYEMQPGEKCTFYLDHNLDEIYFFYRPPHDARDDE